MIKHKQKLDRYSFMWSEVRLLIAAVALFAGGVPALYFLFPTAQGFGFLATLLTLSWIASGVASAFLAYRWLKGGRSLFGKKNELDLCAFLVSVVSGVNLGIVGLGGRNIGMTISSNRIVFAVVGVIYLWSAWQLWKSWKASGKKVF
ncbi:MAG: hypothetical protein UY56_C0001G0026 [Parcubacteria group bacterium GW2011_GWA1_50_14]|uniref:Uncharacterized protein n=2 Tax=Candidatus Colwelliibacteriota TaxID=1817904 RepID=A0A1G1ZD64_9BACT|nr:MAG: hypothetical protein UY56_C0001G0026 [Parcubacteria group bacterium GW2011_GWA1_50_14]OGY58721.1 MAG: hypothetical protein A3C03_01770 [Candidatus Colwellbacteria bacterium RIFCSPHIGHO2_02_FULL_45_17]OGY61063.1 MAG: hypothetical protein A3I33_00325 [Candidatus Colwellbacteria bacterium RIFCSPLOWO2_02_FULL_45_11]OGY62551.1 MAG: hypothetical protein A3G58_01790 [Candidatus Colwellbacteria bacterium RIFCSPLOWO2_12_FULL_46_17]